MEVKEGERREEGVEEVEVKEYIRTCNADKSIYIHFDIR